MGEREDENSIVLYRISITLDDSLTSIPFPLRREREKENDVVDKGLNKGDSMSI